MSRTPRPANKTLSRMRKLPLGNPCAGRDAATELEHPIGQPADESGIDCRFGDAACGPKMNVRLQRRFRRLRVVSSNKIAPDSLDFCCEWSVAVGPGGSG